MPPQTLETTVRKLEERVTTLEQLPGRIDSLTSEVVQLRVDIAGEFSALRRELREEMVARDASLRVAMEASDARLREAMEAGFAGLRQMIEADHASLSQAIEDTRRGNRVLFEEYVERFKKINEGNAADPGKRRRGRKRPE